MNYSKNNSTLPSVYKRVLSIWYRHFRVYSSDFFSNAFPPFFEPLMYLAGLSLGIGMYVSNIGTVDFTLYLASGLIVTSAMYTAAFECTYSTFIRLEFDKIYDGMLGAPLSPTDLMIGELLFVSTKGMFFSFAVLTVTWAFGIITYPLSIFTLLVGFISGLMFATVSLLVTAYVKNINHFNFYFTGFLTPMFFFSGIIYPTSNLPKYLQYVSEFLPLTHAVNLSRAFCIPNNLDASIVYDFLYSIIFIIITGYFAIKKISKRMVF